MLRFMALIGALLWARHPSSLDYLYPQTKPSEGLVSYIPPLSQYSTKQFMQTVSLKRMDLLVAENNRSVALSSVTDKVLVVPKSFAHKQA